MMRLLLLSLLAFPAYAQNCEADTQERAARYLEWLALDANLNGEGKTSVYLEAAQRIRENPSTELLSTKQWVFWTAPK